MKIDVKFQISDTLSALYFMILYAMLPFLLLFALFAGFSYMVSANFASFVSFVSGSLAGLTHMSLWRYVASTEGYATENSYKTPDGIIVLLGVAFSLVFISIFLGSTLSLIIFNILS